ncbi:MAG: DNA mismatch repair protein [Candidatus Cloacimonadota bacterium]|nr:MAG: DNA mismatch repair protein [Candidatus Cloacimonadota bacterium]PIE78164.1 MAG: DNA mismatch repair protein [Candidatus Delongbacteria bacterium]
MTYYKKAKEKHLENYNKLKKRYNTISVIRLLVVILFVFCIYNPFFTEHHIFEVCSVLLFFIFLVLIKIHNTISWEKLFNKNIISINSDEISYLDGITIPFENGKEFIDHKHIYTYDLDIFGENSLFQNINRTSTYVGYKYLSNLLLEKLPENEIKLNQQAVQELTKEIEWRQKLMAIAKINKDSKSNYENLISWSKKKEKQFSKLLNILIYILPIIFVFSIIATIYNPSYISITTSIFIINLIIASCKIKEVKKNLLEVDKVSEIINKYGDILSEIEKKQFKSSRLSELQTKLSDNSNSASRKIKTLSMLFSNIESVQNGMAFLFLNGIFLFHLHALNSLLKWKQNHCREIEKWLSVIGEFEMLNSLANFSYNNPKFVFPLLNNENRIDVENLGHPLVNRNVRICNSISFNNNNLIILTGSNMSGKSTFLRTLGINMLLAGIGSCVCATKANINPLKIVVSMRQTDSLDRKESYFYAEIRRLREIIDNLKVSKCFVILDEILRGTNSDDKKAGTIKIIENLINKNAIGIIATHDLEICKIANDYPNRLFNKCFESKIVDNELIFDYKLKNGICKNKNAIFIMKKMKIIKIGKPPVPLEESQSLTYS